MLQLQNIIIDRVKDTIQLKNAKTHHQSATGSHLNRNHQCYSKTGSQQWRRRESQRLLKQQYYLKELKDKEISKAEVCDLIKAVSTLYDPQICKEYGQLSRKSVGSSDKDNEIQSRDSQDIAILFSSLLKRHFHPKISHILETIKRRDQDVKEYVYLMWLSEWSKVVFINYIGNKPQPSTDLRMKTLTSTFTLRWEANENRHQKILSSHKDTKLSASSDRKMKTELYQSRPQTSNHNRVIFFSREHLYSFLKTELTSAYAFHSRCLDLDHQYLSRITKISKKINLNQYLDSMAGFLARNANGWIAEGIDDYKDVCREKMPELVEMQMQGVRSIVSRQGLDWRQQAKVERRYGQDRRVKTASNQSDFQTKTFLKPSKRRQLVPSSDVKQQPKKQLQKRVLATQISASFFNSCFSASRIPYSEAAQSAFKPSSVNKAGHKAENNPEQQRKTYQFNFIRRKQPSNRHELFTKLNSTFMVCNRKGYASGVAKFSQNRPKCKDDGKEQVTGCSENSKMDRSVFILDCSQAPDMARMNRQQLRLRGKRSVMLIAREAVLLGTARKEKLVIHES